MIGKLDERLLERRLVARERSGRAMGRFTMVGLICSSSNNDFVATSPAFSAASRLTSTPPYPDLAASLANSGHPMPLPAVSAPFNDTNIASARG